MKKIEPSKPTGKHYEYKPGRTPYRFSMGAIERFAVVNHKGRLTVVWINSGGTYLTRHKMGKTKVKKLIGWLAQYLVEVDPDPISLSIAATKAHATRIRAEQDKIASELGL